MLVEVAIAPSCIKSDLLKAAAQRDRTSYNYMNERCLYGGDRSTMHKQRSPEIFCPNASPLQNTYLVLFVKYFY
jgi:hypothetical protein